MSDDFTDKVFKQLCEDLELPVPVTEHSFHPVRKWRFDYAWPDQMVALEVEGGIWRPGGGAHSRPKNIERDIEKYNTATLMGWRILRVQPAHLLKQDTIKMIRKILIFN